MSTWVTIDEIYSGPPGCKWTLHWSGGDACVNYSKRGTVRIECSSVSDYYSLSTTITGKSGTYSNTAFFSSGCDGNMSGSFS